MTDSLLEDLLHLRATLADLEDDPGGTLDYALTVIRHIALAHDNLREHLRLEREQQLAEYGWREIWVPLDFKGCWYVLPRLDSKASK